MVNDTNQPFDFEYMFYSWRKHWSKSDLVLGLTQAPRVYKLTLFWSSSSTQTLEIGSSDGK